jgi:hypothetical protein
MYRFHRVQGMFLILLAAFVPFALSQADIPKIISYQGKITDSGGDARCRWGLCHAVCHL